MEKNKKTIRPYIVDVEASGFGSQSYPIEIGLALGPDTRYCSLIIPSPQWTHWDKAAEKTHAISRDLLARHGKPLVRVAKELNQILGQLIVFSDGWAVDKPWITRLFSEAGIGQTFRVSPLERILTQSQMEIWDETKTEVIKSNNLIRHRASADAFIVQETFIRTQIKTLG